MDENTMEQTPTSGPCDPRLAAAIASGDSSTVSALLAGGRTPDCYIGSYTALVSAIYAGQQEVAAALIDGGAKLTLLDEQDFQLAGDPMIAAVGMHDLRTTRMMLERGAPLRNGVDPDTVVHLAAKNNDLPMLELCWEFGGVESLEWTDTNCDTPLNAAIRGNAVEAARFLLEHGANPSGDVFETPLSLAREVGSHERMMKLLEKFGAQEKG